MSEETESIHCPSISPHGDVCTLTRGHEDQHERHALAERVASWSQSSDEPVPGSKADKAEDNEIRARMQHGLDTDPHWNDDADTLPKRTPRCMARERIGSIVLACGLGKGHAGPCEWPQAEDAARIESERLESLLRERLHGRQPLLRLTQLPPIEHAVRVRFVDLPSRPTQSETVFGSITVMRSGGFALVVDRFNHVAHLEGERELWEGFGEKIGAVHVLLYPGTLDTDDLMDI